MRNFGVLRLACYQRIEPRSHEMIMQIERRNISAAPYDDIAMLTWATEEDLQLSLTARLAWLGGERGVTVTSPRGRNGRSAPRWRVAAHSRDGQFACMSGS